MSFSIAGKTAIITGAASGVGLAIGRHFADEGANVVLADIDGARLKAELGDDLRDETHIQAFTGDLSQKLTVANLLSTTLDAFDRVDILVNATRQLQLSDPLDSEADAVEPMIAQNLMTPLRVSQAVARRMIAQAEDDDDATCIGSIINLSSIAGQRAHPSLLGFSIAAAGLDHMTRSLAVALAPHRVRVNAVATGSVLSESLRKVLREEQGLRERIAAATPLGRIAPASEVVQTVQYLASDASSFMTGQVISVDGGRTLVDSAAHPAH